MPAPHPSATSAAEREFVISRTFDAPRELVFRAWTDPKHMARWWGPHRMTNPVCEIDARPGGAYRVVMRSPEGVEYPCRGVFKEVVAPSRLVMTMDCSEHPPEWHDLVKPGRRKEENNPAGELIITVTFEQDGAGTRMTVCTRFESTAIRNAMVKMGMNEGWSESFERLAEVVTRT